MVAQSHVLCSYYCWKKFKNMGVDFLKSHFKCITFGLMPMADNFFKQYTESIPGARDCFCHIVQKNDIIPKLFGAFNMSRIQVCVYSSLFFFPYVQKKSFLMTIITESLNYFCSIGHRHRVPRYHNVPLCSCCYLYFRIDCGN